MPDRWSTDQVRALAPDAASGRAAGKLAVPAPWSQTGVADGDPPLLWGLCKGSGSRPYQACVDLAEPAYRCSCPSRKFPCKHALALLTLWADGQVGKGEPPEWATEWRDGRRARRSRAEARAAATPADPEAARRRARQRADRVAGGLAELDRWLTDRVRQGLAAAIGYRDVDATAARLVDAQAGAAATTVRRLAAVTGPDAPARLLDELALLHLLTRAYGRVDTLDASLAATVRSRVGLPVSQQEVLATGAVRDRWFVLGHRDEVDDKLTTRRVWLRGAESGAAALVLSFAAPGQALAADLVDGTSVDADLHFYPAARPLRALVGTRHGAATPAAPPPAGDIGTALAEHAAALADEPWLDGWPMLLADAVLTRHDGRWHVATGDGAALPLHPECGDPWRAVAVGGGHRRTIAVEWTPRGAWPLGLFATAPIGASDG